jgi:hypothetical protein
MQFQIECKPLFEQRCCLICDRAFITKEARVIACNDQGTSQGEVCPTCLAKGYQWLNNRFETK